MYTLHTLVYSTYTTLSRNV